jgi:hypothetical protein
MALRLAVHSLAGTSCRFNPVSSRDEWEACKSIVRSTRMSARGIAKVLSEMHVGEDGKTWTSPLRMAICQQFWEFVKWLLDVGACPNLGEQERNCGRCVVHCTMCTRPGLSQWADTVLQLAGGLGLVYCREGLGHGVVSAEWERYHRAERTAWMQAVARRQCVKL